MLGGATEGTSTCGSDHFRLTTSGCQAWTPACGPSVSPPPLPLLGSLPPPGPGMAGVVGSGEESETSTDPTGHGAASLGPAHPQCPGRARRTAGWGRREHTPVQKDASGWVSLGKDRAGELATMGIIGILTPWAHLLDLASHKTRAPAESLTQARVHTCSQSCNSRTHTYTHEHTHTGPRTTPQTRASAAPGRGS